MNQGLRTQIYCYFPTSHDLEIASEITPVRACSDMPCVSFLLPPSLDRRDVPPQSQQQPWDLFFYCQQGQSSVEVTQGGADLHAGGLGWEITSG